MMGKTAALAVVGMLLVPSVSRGDDRADYNQVADLTAQCALAAQTMEKAKPCREILAEYLKKQGDSDAVAEANALTFVIETLNNQKTVSAPVGKGFSQEASVRPSVPI